MRVRRTEHPPPLRHPKSSEAGQRISTPTRNAHDALKRCRFNYYGPLGMRRGTPLE